MGPILPTGLVAGHSVTDDRGRCGPPVLQPRSRVHLSMCYIQFAGKAAIVFLKKYNWMVFMMEKECFICEVRTEFVYVIWKKFSLQYSPSNMNFKISAHAQFCQCYQTFVSRHSFSQTYQNQIKYISDTPDAQPISCATYWNSSFLIAFLSSFSKAPLYLQRTFTRRTSGHCLGAPRRVNPPFFRYSKHIVAGPSGCAV